MIKFRAWQKFHKMMLLVTNLRFKEGEIVGIEVFYDIENGQRHINYSDNSTDFKLQVDGEDVFVLMQSTGLKDKYGVEIYEGDVVVDRWANEYTPVFQNGIYMAYNPKHLMQNDPSTQFNIIWKDGCEIIGNIYETPDLLKGADE